MPDEPAAGLISIGEFARRTRLTVKALRIYDRIGLLRPVATDETSGYRRYGAAQVGTGQLIGLMRAADLSLAEIGLILEDLAVGPDPAETRLEGLLADIERRHAARTLLIRHVQAALQGGENPMFPIATRRVPFRRLMSIQRRLHQPEIDGFVREASAAFAEHLAGTEATGPFTLIFHGAVDAENDGPLEAALGCPADVQPSDRIGIRTEPAHDEAYTTINKAQWAYPAILVAYNAVGCSAEVASRPGSHLSCREVYLADPDVIEENEVVCEIAFPLGQP
ncbi:MAG TPA: MerR family transcriptional regulator [Solirubrobacteraceae bacterium]